MSSVLDPATSAGAKAPAFGRFFLPGPTEVPPDVLQAMSRPMISHRGAEFESLMARIAPRLAKVFRTTRAVHCVTSSATGLMEAGVRNAVRERVLCLVGGSFGERFYKASVNSGIPADVLEAPFGKPHTPEMLADALKDGKYDTITVVHSETSSGVLNPIRELAQVAHASGDVAVIVDTVSSMAAAPIESDGWALDYVLTGSQKAIALPPGLAFCAPNERILARARASARRGLYFDLLELDESTRKHVTPNTPVISLLFALDVQLDRIMAEGMEGRWARHAQMAERAWAWAESRGLRVLAPAGYRSPAVTCIMMPEGKSGSAVAGAMQARGFVIATGYGARKDEMVRIGHMGEHTMGELEAVLAALGEVMGR